MGSTSKLWNKHLQHSLWMLRGTKSLSELLRERPGLKDAFSISEETPLRPHDIRLRPPGPWHIPAHKPPPVSLGCAARCRSAATRRQLPSETPRLRGLQERVSPFVIPDPKHLYAGSLQQLGWHRERMEAHGWGDGRAGAGLLLPSAAPGLSSAQTSLET